MLPISILSLQQLKEFWTLLYGCRQMLKLLLVWFYTFAASKTLPPAGLLQRAKTWSWSFILILNRANRAGA